MRSPLNGEHTIDQPILLLERFEYEHICWNTKDGKLCFLEQFYQVKQMIRGLKGKTILTYSQMLNW